MISIQTFGDLVNFHPHLHCLVTDGCFMPNGWFYVLPEIDVKKLESLFRHKILKLLLKEKRISQEWVEKLLSWKNSGFNIHNQVKIKSQDSRGRECLAQYILRSPFSQEKMTYREETKSVLYRAKMKPGVKKNFAVFPVMDWIATLTAHIPNKGEQMVRYCGYYSNVARGKRKKEKPQENEVNWKPEVIEIAPPLVSKELKKRWSHLIRKVYETDPLTCPKCQGEMWFDELTTLRKPEGRIISFIDQPEVIKKILQHLGLWEESHAPQLIGPGLEVQEPCGRIDNHPTGGKVDLLNDLFYRRDEVLLGRARYHVEIASLFGPYLGDLPDPLTLGVEDIEAEDLIVIILSSM